VADILINFNFRVNCHQHTVAVLVPSFNIVDTIGILQVGPVILILNVVQHRFVAAATPCGSSIPAVVHLGLTAPAVIAWRSGLIWDITFKRVNLSILGREFVVGVLLLSMVFLDLSLAGDLDSWDDGFDWATVVLLADGATCGTLQVTIDVVVLEIIILTEPLLQSFPEQFGVLQQIVSV
jgi:hypothetical protein